MKHYIFSLIFILAFCIGDCPNLCAQSDVTQSASNAGNIRYQDLPYLERRVIVANKSKELHAGTLIVRLVSYDSKINHLNKVGRTKEADELKAKVDFWNKELISQFEKSYDFSDVVFTYGEDLSKYLKKEATEIFVDNELQLNKSVKIKEGTIFIFAAQVKDNYYLYDQYMNRIPEPIPHGVRYDMDERIDLDGHKWWLSLTKGPDVDNDVFYFNALLHRTLKKALKRKL